MKATLRTTLATVAVATLSAITSVSEAQSDERAPRARVPAGPLGPNGDFGDPLPGLDDVLTAAFNDGLSEFQSVDTAASGLGPAFNNNSCVACHSSPAPGGDSNILETRFGHVDNGRFDPMIELGGSLLQQSAIRPQCQEFVPATANVTARRKTTPLFGLGLIEAIPDDTIKALAARSKPDGVSGRASSVVDVASGQTLVGRFGWKAQQATLLAFSGDAYVNEMGITNRLFPAENAPNGSAALLANCDSVADPEDRTDPATGKADIDRFTDFMRLLAPPPRLPMTPSALAGALTFRQSGCSSCHTPILLTGPSSIAALDRKIVALFSDLLLHDMGSLGDGIAQGTAGMTEMKTPPLWGLRSRQTYLHDGRASTVDMAIRAHDGEASAARDRYSNLQHGDQMNLLEFLGRI